MLDFDGGESIVWIAIYTLCFLWEKRKCSKPANLDELRARIHADATLLQDTKHTLTANVILCHISQ